jgi:hypothetical protein
MSGQNMVLPRKNPKTDRKPRPSLNACYYVQLIASLLDKKLNLINYLAQAAKP